MTTPRPSNWDWVKAAGDCTAPVMFGTLHTLAQQNVETRNTQLENGKFAASENAGAEFCVGLDTPNLRQKAWFSLLDLNTIRVKFRDTETIYTVRLDDTGRCKLWCEDQSFDPWQVLKTALEPILFPV